LSGSAADRPLRSGYTTGACAAAAARAASRAALGLAIADSVEIDLPGGDKASFALKTCGVSEGVGRASVIKDAGDDPDVTNGAEIMAEARVIDSGIIVLGGEGVGTVTRPGLPVEIGKPAINPVPMSMIERSAKAALTEAASGRGLEITIIVPEGRKRAEQTLNARLGIVGGISILGTTGIVTPLSARAWTATIESSMSVAHASGFDEIIMCSGRTSERALMKRYGLDESACVMMGDYVQFSLQEAARWKFSRLLIGAQWAKMVKIAMGTPDTHVRAGALDTTEAAAFIRSLGIALPDKGYNTAREMLDYIDADGMASVCRKAADYARSVSGLSAVTHLVSYGGEIIATSE